MTKAKVNPPKKDKTNTNAEVTFDSTSMVATIAPINPDARPAPHLVYSEAADAAIQHISSTMMRSDELGWMMSTSYDKATGEIYVHDIFIPKQVVTSVATSMDKEDYNRMILEEFIPKAEAHGEGLHLNAWFHLHPQNLGVNPSPQDEQQVAEYLADNTHWPYFVRGIVNGKGASKIDVYFPEDNLLYTCVDEYIDRPRFPEVLSYINDCCKTKVTKPKPAINRWHLDEMAV